MIRKSAVNVFGKISENTYIFVLNTVSNLRANTGDKENGGRGGTIK